MFREVLIDDLKVLSPMVISSVNEKIADGKDVYPNPFVNNVHLKNSRNIKKIKIYDASGILIRSLENTTSWNGQDRYGNVVSSGLYIMRVYSGDDIKSYKLIKK